MHILIIPSWYPKDELDLNGCFFKEHAHAMAESLDKVGVLSVTFRPLYHLFSDRLYFYREVELDGVVDTYRGFGINWFPKCHRAISLLHVYHGYKMFKEYIVKHEYPDVIHVQSSGYASFLARYIHKKHGVPYIVTEHCSAFQRRLVSEKASKYILSANKQASFCTAVSSALSDFLNAILPEKKWTVTPNMVCDDFFKIELSELKATKKFTFITVSMLNQNKSIDLVIKSFSRLVISGFDVKLHIIGDGPEKENLILLSNRLGLAKKITFFGSVARKVIPHEIVQADALIVASKFETFGVVAAEAMALGKPVIATRCGGPEDIVTKDSGLLIDSNSEEQMLEAMAYMVKHKPFFVPADIREYCYGMFSKKAIVRKYKSIYDSVKI